MESNGIGYLEPLLKSMGILRSIQGRKSNLFALSVWFARACRSLSYANSYTYAANQICRGGTEIAPRVRGSNVLRFLRGLRVPATESQLALTLVVSLVFLAVMLMGLIWQANVITLQREIIHSLSGI
jgi:hypothetical protein